MRRKRNHFKRAVCLVSACLSKCLSWISKQTYHTNRSTMEETHNVFNTFAAAGLESDGEESQLIVDLPCEDNKKRKAEGDVNGDQTQNVSDQKRKRHTVAYKRGIWNNETYFPSLHKYSDVKNIFSWAQASYLKSTYPMTYILHFDETFDMEYLKQFRKELVDCSSFDIVNVTFDQEGNILNDRKSSSKSKIPIYFVEYPHVINYTHIANLKLAGFYNKIHIAILLNINNYSRYCQFGLKFPAHTNILHNGSQLTHTLQFLKDTEKMEPKEDCPKNSDIVYGLKALDKTSHKLNKKFDRLIKAIQKGDILHRKGKEAPDGISKQSGTILEKNPTV